MVWLVGTASFLCKNPVVLHFYIACQLFQRSSTFHIAASHELTFLPIPTLSTAVFLRSRFRGCVAVLHCSLTCISLMINSVHVLICLPDICIYLKWNTFVFSPCFKNQLFILLLSCRSSWYIMCTKEQKPLLDTLSENIFSQPVVCFFSFLMVFFEAQNL